MITVAMQNWQVIAPAFAGRILNSLAEGVAIALLGWMLLPLLGRRNPRVRFAVWFATLIAVAVLPFRNYDAAIAQSAETSASSAIRLPVSWASYIFVVWAVIASAGLLRIAFACWRLRRLRSRCRDVDVASLHPMLRHTLETSGQRGKINLCTSDELRVPAAVGFFNPAIVIPGWALQDLSTAELNAVLLHELAHLRRRDSWTNLAQTVVRALLFFQPAIWWIGRGLSLEREMACDDFVLAATSDPNAYAQCLVSVAEKSFLRRSLALAQAAVGHMRQTSQRVARILNLNRPAATRVWQPALALLAVSIAGILVLPHARKLVAFEDSLPTLPAAASNLPIAFAVDNSHAAVQAQLVPAALRLSTSPTNTTAILKRRVKKVENLPINEVAANVKQPEPHSPQLVRTRSEAVEPAGPARSLLLVMQSEQIDDAGQVVWSISVWRLTVFHPADPQAHREINPKST